MKYKHCKKHNINSENNSELFFIKNQKTFIKNGKQCGPYKSTSCILCRRQSCMKYYKKNVVKEKERQRVYLEKPESKAKARIRKLKFVKNNREHIRKYLIIGKKIEKKLILCMV